MCVCLRVHQLTTTFPLFLFHSFHFGTFPPVMMHTGGFRFRACWPIKFVFGPWSEVCGSRRCGGGCVPWSLIGLLACGRTTLEARPQTLQVLVRFTVSPARTRQRGYSCSQGGAVRGESKKMSEAAVRWKSIATRVHVV